MYSRHISSDITDYTNLFRLGNFVVPYIVVFGDTRPDAQWLPHESVVIRKKQGGYKIPEEASQFRPNLPCDEVKCRVDSYVWTPTSLQLSLQPIRYSDYVASGEHLDDRLSPGAWTLRKKYFPRVSFDGLQGGPLSNILGVGILIKTRDGKLLFAKRRKDLTINPGTYGYTASGTADWSVDPDPFVDAIRELREETGINIPASNSRLMCMGIDAKRLYIQLSYFIESSETASMLLSTFNESIHDDESTDLLAVNDDPMELVSWMKQVEMEPAAKAALLTYALSRHGHDEILSELDIRLPHSSERRSLAAEWETRARRNGLYSVTSLRYASDRLEAESDRYVKELLDFMGNQWKGRHILELGSGIGRITRHLEKEAASVTCVELSQEMIRRHQQYGASSNVLLVNDFAQDYIPIAPHDWAVVSQTLIHQKLDTDFDSFIQVLRNAAPTVVVAENYAPSHQAHSTATVHRPIEHIIRAMKGFQLKKRKQHLLFDDNIEFLFFEVEHV